VDPIVSLTDFVNIALGGLATGAIYALLAISYDIIFTTTGVLNFAQGDLMMVGAMLFAGLGGTLMWPMVGTIVVVVAVGLLIGALEERVAVRPATLRGQGALGWAISTLGVSIILQSVVTLIMGGDVRAVPNIIAGRPIWSGSILLIPDSLVIIAASAAIAGAFALFYNRTYLGKALGAVEQDRYGAVLRGIPVSAFATLAFALGAAVAAGTGFVAGPLTQATATMGISFALKGFIAAALGGIPKMWGALIAGWVLGVVEAFVGYGVGASYQVPVVFAILLIALALRPHGLLGGGTVREL
jgi:branched-chain amino acid transport system permease protein